MSKKSADVAHSVGVILLTAGAAGLTFFAFFAVIALPIYCLGVVLILGSRLEQLKEGLRTVIVSVIYVLGFWFVWWYANKAQPEIFLIPEGYVGKVNVVFKKGCGEPIHRSDEGIVYVIPDDGVLLVDGELRTGIIDHTYHYIDDVGIRREIPAENGGDPKLRIADSSSIEGEFNKVKVYHSGRVGTIGDIINGSGQITSKDEQYQFLEFYVTSQTDLENVVDYQYNRQFDSLRSKKINGCAR